MSTVPGLDDHLDDYGHAGTRPYTDELLYGRLPTVGPDCRDGKHRACRGDAWDTRTAQPAVCGCGCHCDCDGSDDHPYTCDRHT